MNETKVIGPYEIGYETPRRPRARTVSIKRLSQRELYRGTAEYPIEEWASYARPSKREDCLQGEHAERPCPFVSCKYHLYLDVNHNRGRPGKGAAGGGSIKMNFPDLEVWELPESCALDVADRGGVTLEEVGVIMNLTRERVRQLQTRGLAKLKPLADLAALQDFLCDDFEADSRSIGDAISMPARTSTRRK